MMSIRHSVQHLAAWGPNTRSIFRSVASKRRSYRCQHQNYVSVTFFSSISNPTDETDTTRKTEHRPSESTANALTSSPVAKTKPRKRMFIPPKAAVKLTQKSRQYLKLLMQNSPKGDQTKGIMLNYQQASDGTPRMVFTFRFLTSDDEVHPMDEAVSLEVLEDGITPKPPKDSMNDGLPKLYVNHNAILKVLGSTLDVDDRYNLVLFDSEGNQLEPNA